MDGYTMGTIRIGNLDSICMNNQTAVSCEDLNEFKIQVVLPGYTIDEVFVEYEKEKVTVKTVPLNKDGDWNQNWKIESTGSYYIPGADIESTSVHLKNGVLYITAPKKVKGVQVKVWDD